MNFSEEEKMAIVYEYQDGTDVKALCKEYKTSKSCVYRWIQQFTERSISKSNIKISFRQIQKLEYEVKRLRTENEIFRKCGCSPASPLAEKLMVMESLKEHYSVHALCRTLNVLRSTFYHYLFRSQEKTMFEQSDDEVRPIIKDIFAKSKERFGARKIKTKLAESGFIVSQKRVTRLMKEMSLIESVKIFV